MVLVASLASRGDEMGFTRRMNEKSSDQSRWRLFKDMQSAPVGTVVEQQCAVCALTGVCRWEKIGSEGIVGDLLALCADHESELGVRNDDYRYLYGLSGPGSFPRILTRDDVTQFLGHLHYIPASRGLKAPSHLRFPECHDGELLRILVKLNAIVNGDHFSGWVVRESFVIAVHVQDGSWYSEFRTDGTIWKSELQHGN